MSFLEVVDAILIKPLELLFEVVYVMADKIVGNPGLSIVVLSLFMNFLVLPLYMRADEVQEEERAIEKKLQMGVTHIKQTFRGDERMMMLQTYYRQNNYKPVYVLRSAISLLLQIPFFVAAYRFLSNLQLLKGVSFGPIVDLGSPDAMLQIGGATLHALPIIMTAVNLVTCLIFAKGSSLKEKIQLYAMALFFLVFLYDSPAGLVFYWTLNNVFSLGKTCCYKWLPLMRGLQGRPERKKSAHGTENRKLFFSGSLFLAVLTGAVIPSSVVKSSPLEFIDAAHFYSPLWFVANSFCLAFGLFVIWAGVFYYLAPPALRVYYDRAAWILAGVSVVDYLFFGKNLGQLSRELTFQNGLDFTLTAQIQNAFVVLAASAAFYAIYRRRDKLASEILMAGALALCCMAAVNAADIRSVVEDAKARGAEEEELPVFTLSKTGKNVIVMVLDQAIGKYIPYFFAEKPELKEQFAGFTYYANTLSFGAHTNFGSPALFGGYEYTPAEINKRDGESLVSKQNEALKLMPVLFDGNGYQVTVCDPPYAGYQWIPDLSIYDDYPKIKSYILDGKFPNAALESQWIQFDKRNFFCYAILKISPLCFQKNIYDLGRYYQSKEASDAYYQTVTGMHTANGLLAGFMDCYRELAAYPDLTVPTDESVNTFLMLVNEAAHNPMLLQEPAYEPSPEVDNTEYERMHQDRYTINGQTMRMTTHTHAMFYQINMAALIQLGKWFDYMRENGVYDNTRIILASDHGRTTLRDGDERRLGERDIECFYPLLMVKDFGSREFAVSEEFMTNGDVPTFAMKDLIADPVNPFTGKAINDSAKAAHDQYVIASDEGLTATNHGNTFLPSKWYSVHDDMRDVNNWKLLSEEETVLPPVEDAEVKTGQGK